jgi:hypothetical protein
MSGSRSSDPQPRLRRKLNAVEGRWIINTHGVGYRLI